MARRVPLLFCLREVANPRGGARFVLIHRPNLRPMIAASLYEAHLSAGYRSSHTVRTRLQHIAYLYSWAEDAQVDLESVALTGSGLEARGVRSFAAWMRNRYGSQLESSSAARRSFNQLLSNCERFSVWFIEQCGECSDRSRRAIDLQMRINHERRAWSTSLLRAGTRAIAPDIADEDIARIERYLSPERRKSETGPHIAYRDYLIWRMAIETGMRIGEILAIRLADCPRRNAHYFSVVRIDERGDDYRDPRGARAPRPKTLSRDLGFILSKSVFPRLATEYIAEHRFKVEKRVGRAPIRRFNLPHCFLLVGRRGDPLSSRAAEDIAERISTHTGIHFTWHLARHAFFNRAYGAISAIEDRTERQVRLMDLVYWGGWKSPESLQIYTERARRDRARGALRIWQLGSGEWAALESEFPS